MPRSTRPKLDTERGAPDAEHAAPTEHGQPYCGRAALSFMLLGLFVGCVLSQAHSERLQLWAAVFLLTGYFGGVILAIISLSRREPVGLAIATLIVAGVVVLLLAAFWALLWWMFASQAPCEGGPFCFNPA